jgi:hypothetical protein
MATTSPAIIIIVLEIPIAIPIPVVVVISPTSVAVPISGEVAAPFVPGGYPTGAWVGRAGPVTGVPLISVFRWIPVALYPDKLRAGAWW